ncbi:CBO0543 family protein [Neobacillus sp. B4I6]|uniref:CBO0543 family protein n=1 Tax=Neobacillus sp. B4I6 TaxID=3373925 RepID=UPI003D2252CD
MKIFYFQLSVFTYIKQLIIQDILVIILKCALYTSVLTIIEVLLERYTDLIEYHTWTWRHTFISTFFLMMFIRILIKLINRHER